MVTHTTTEYTMDVVERTVFIYTAATVEQTVTVVQILVTGMTQIVVVVAPVTPAVVVSPPIDVLLLSHNMYQLSYPRSNHMLDSLFLHDQQIDKTYNTSS